MSKRCPMLVPCPAVFSRSTITGGPTAQVPDRVPLRSARSPAPLLPPCEIPGVEREKDAQRTRLSISSWKAASDFPAQSRIRGGQVYEVAAMSQTGPDPGARFRLPEPRQVEFRQSSCLSTAHCSSETVEA